MAQDNRTAPKDISTFSPRHRPAGTAKLSVDCNVAQGKLIQWPTSPLNQPADRTITTVQIAIEDQVFAEQLGSLLAGDNRHRVYFVDRPNPAMDGVVVVDETTLGRLGVLEESVAVRCIVLKKDSSDPDKLWDAGVRYLVPAEYPPSLVQTVILGTEMRLNIEQSSR